MRDLTECLRPTADVRRLGVAAMRERGTALVGAQRVERGVDRDPIEPREEVGATIERGEPAIRANEALLRDVIRVTVITENMECCCVHASLMTSHQATESFS